MEIVTYVAAGGLVCASIVIVGVSIWYARRTSRESAKRTTLAENQRVLQKQVDQKAKQEFEKVVADNADFIKKDVRRAGAKVSGYMEKEISHTVEDELALYKNSAGKMNKTLEATISQLQVDAQTQQKALFNQVAAEQKQMSLQLATQYQQVTQTIEQQVTAEAERRMKRFEDNMAAVVQSYVTTAVGDQLDVTTDLAYILKQLETNKAAILEDIKGGVV